MPPNPSHPQPGPSQESVWDYPRPPRLETVDETLRVIVGGETIAATRNGYRVLETSHPPVYYFPPNNVQRHLLTATSLTSFCEFKGVATYWTLVVGSRRIQNAAWSYINPTKRFQPIKDCFAFYASRVDACWVGDEHVRAQEGDFYGGWITSRIVGPFKGGPGTRGW